MPDVNRALAAYHVHLVSESNVARSELDNKVLPFEIIGTENPEADPFFLHDHFSSYYNLTTRLNVFVMIRTFIIL